MRLQTSVFPDRVEILDVENLAIQCQRAKELEEAGEFERAREALRSFWQEVGERPETTGLTDVETAELLLRAGSLTGWIGSAGQVSGAQERAKDLVSESASLFQSLGLIEKSAEARVDLAICYWREGALDEARVSLRHALDSLGDLDSEQRLRALLNSAIVEKVATRYKEALRIYREAAPLFEASSNNALKGKFHNSYATLLKSLGVSQEREEYIDQALLEFSAAGFHFEQAGHKRFRARVENNEVSLFASLGRFAEAQEHAHRARNLFQSLGDIGGIAGVDETCAQTLLLQGRNEEAERFARSAVRALERGGEHSMLAEALTTQGKALARLGRHVAANNTLKRAMEVAEQAGDPNGGGIAALTVIEELGTGIQPQDLRDYYRRAESLLSNSQDSRIASRLGECARRLLAATESSRLTQSSSDSLPGGPVAQFSADQSGSSPSEGATCSLETEVLRYEGTLIRQALEASGGSITRAARLLGVSHQGLAFILNGRHSDLLSIRTPVKRRRRSIIRFH